ncbi:MAG: PEP-CTERM sorting domain-containing protein [Motiliproteus sp.]
MTTKNSLLPIGQAIAVVALVAFSNQAAAVIIDSFEAPNAVGAAPLPPAIVVSGNVTVETGSGFLDGFGGSPTTTVMATHGAQFAYLTNGPGATGAGDSGVDRTGDGAAESDVAIMTVGFAAAAGDMVSFDWDLLTEEISGGVPDPFEILLDGATILAGAIGFDNGTFPSVVGFSDVEIVGPDGSSFFDGRLGWASFLSGPLTAGAHTLEFFVGDEGFLDGTPDDIVETALLVDNIELTTPQVSVPEPGTLMLSIIGLAGLGMRRFKKA